MSSSVVVSDEMRSFLAKSGEHGTKLLSVLGRQHRFLSACETEVGRELLRDALSRADVLLEKIVDESATVEERAEFRVLKRLLLVWAERIQLYFKNLEKLPKEEK